jgi:myosin-5
MHSLTDSVWIRSKEHVWEAVKVHVREEDQVTVLATDGQLVAYGPSDVLSVDPSHLEDQDDLCAVNNLHDAPLLDILRRRFCNNVIYTDIGRVLISINPYTLIPGMYDDPLKYLTTDDPFEDLITHSTKPHIFKLADDALRLFHDLNHLSKATNQSIIVSGESGAGKTEAAKLVMHFLILANNKQNERVTTDKSEAEKDHSLGLHLKSVLEESNLILEAFGNAKTIRNDNSSRFGKYIKLQYSNNQLSSAFTSVFLLEKSRLVLVSPGERNYHVFYQLLRAALAEKVADSDAGEAADTETGEVSEADGAAAVADTSNHGRQRSSGDPTLDMESLFLTDVAAFDVLAQGGCTVLSSELEDGNNFAALCKALRAIDLTEADLTRLWELLACILHLGNAKVSEASDESVLPPRPPADESVPAAPAQPTHRKEPRCHIDFTTMPLVKICAILGVSQELFMERLGTRMIKADNRSSIKISVLSAVEVKNNIYSLMKFLYGGIFAWLVQKVNYAHGKLAQTSNSPFSITSPTTQKAALSSFSSTGSFGSDENIDSSENKFIGILDIFGFEILQRNSFEQLCINFANERLQQQFNETIFVNEQAEYEAEGVPVPPIVYLNNQAVIDLFAKKPAGVFVLLEEYSLLNRQMDANNIVSNFNKCHESKNEAYGKNKFDKSDFVIHHFAGDVAYSAVGLLNKNNDSLQEDLKMLVSMSTSDFINDITQREAATDAKHANSRTPGAAPRAVGTRPSFIAAADSTVSAAGGGGGRKIAAISTVSFKFRDQLEDLMKTLRATQPHYIKCVKPNGSKSPSIFTSPLAMQQLLYSGVLDVVRIRRQGYPIQSPFKAFHKALHLLLYDSVTYKVNCSTCSDEQSKELCTEIVSMFLPKEQFAVGKNKIFLKEAAPDLLTAALMQRRHQIAKQIQTSWRFHIQHWKYVNLRRKIVTVQEYYLMRYHRMRLHRLLMGVTFIKAWWWRRKAQKKYKHTRKQVIRIQAVWRAKLAWRLRTRLWENRASAILTNWIRCINKRYALRSVLIKLRKSLIVLQSIARTTKPKQILSNKKEIAVLLAARKAASLRKRQYVSAGKIQIVWRLHQQGLPVNEPIKQLVVKAMVSTFVKNLRRRASVAQAQH